MHLKAHTSEPDGSTIGLVVHGPGASTLGGINQYESDGGERDATPIFSRLYGSIWRPASSSADGSRPVNNQVDPRV